MTDLKAEARRLAEEEGDIITSLTAYAWYMAKHVVTKTHGDTESVCAALLAFGRLVREEDAKVCEEENVLSARQCAAAIRAKALE